MEPLARWIQKPGLCWPFRNKSVFITLHRNHLLQRIAGYRFAQNHGKGAVLWCRLEGGPGASAEKCNMTIRYIVHSDRRWLDFRFWASGDGVPNVHAAQVPGQEFAFFIAVLSSERSHR